MHKSLVLVVVVVVLLVEYRGMHKVLVIVVVVLLVEYRGCIGACGCCCSFVGGISWYA